MAATLPLAPGRFSGRKLGKYEVLSQLSTGGMAEIYLAFQSGLAGFRKLVVLKAILPEIRSDEEFVRMFLDEAKITSAFNHPNIAQVYDLDEDNGELFLAMEFVPGATLVEIAKACRSAQKAIPIGLTLLSVRDAALALHYAHTFVDPLGRPQQVIHRDVAEKNIMVTYDGATKLLDFGIAKSLARMGRTQVGMVKGTSGYMSPEQILGEQLDLRTDIFSLGVVLHECLTGMRLFYGAKPEDGMMATLKNDVPLPSKSNRLVSSALDAVCLKALSRRREDRFSTALEFARELEKVAGSFFWKPEQSGEFVQNLFTDRRDQTRQLYERARLGVEATGEVTLSRFMRPSQPQAQAWVEPQEPKTDPNAVLETPYDTQTPGFDDDRYTLPTKDLPDDLTRPPPPPLSEIDTTAQNSAILNAEWTASQQRYEPPLKALLRKTPKPVWAVAGALVLFVVLYVFEFPPFSGTSNDTERPETEPVTAIPPSNEPPLPAETEKAPDPKTKPEAEPETVTPPPRVKETPKPTEIAKVEPPSSVPLKNGMLTLVTDPFADVYLKSRSLGQTPLYKTPIPAGKHTLRLLGPDRSTYLLTLEIREGKVKALKVALKDLARETTAQ